MKTVILVVEHIQAQIEKARKAIEENYPKMIIATPTNLKDSSDFIIEMKDSIAGVVANLNCPYKKSL